jgi:hypothetical protein
MAYKFDGTKLKDGSKTIFNVNGDKIREGTGSSTVANVSGDKIRKGTGSSTVGNVKNSTLRKGTGSSTWMKMRDIEKEISGHTSDVMRAALWLALHRNV